MSERKRIGIEALLRWAYRDELPKAGASRRGGPLPLGRGWDGVRHYGELLAEIDGDENVWGLAPDLTAMAEPHPDAVRVGEAVEALDGLAPDLPEDWHPLGDIVTAENAELVRDAVRRARAAVLVEGEGGPRLRTSARFLVVRHACAGSTPDWACGSPSVVVESANGKPRWFRRITLVGADGAEYVQEVDGYNRSRQRPHPGAYRKSYLDPDPVGAAVARADWEIWRSALDLLAEALDGLEAHEVVPAIRPVRPWMVEDEAGSRVLASLLPMPEVDRSDVTVGAFYRKRVAGLASRPKSPGRTLDARQSLDIASATDR